MKRRFFINSLGIGFASSLLLNFNGYGNPLSELLELAADERELAEHKIDSIVFSKVKLNYPRLVGIRHLLFENGSRSNGLGIPSWIKKRCRTVDP